MRTKAIKGAESHDRRLNSCELMRAMYVYFSLYTSPMSFYVFFLFWRGKCVQFFYINLVVSICNAIIFRKLVTDDWLAFITKFKIYLYVLLTYHILCEYEQKCLSMCCVQIHDHTKNEKKKQQQVPDWIEFSMKCNNTNSN